MHPQYVERSTKVVSELSGIPQHELYVVWFCKTLQNRKALVSTDTLSGAYWEVTYNGDKGETYVDTYQKAKNVVIADASH